MQLPSLGMTQTAERPRGNAVEGDGFITNTSAGLKGCTTLAEEDKRVAALAQRNGIGSTLVVTFEPPWSRKPRPEPKPKRAPATPPTDITKVPKPDEVATLRALLTVHRAHGVEWPRAWRAASRAVRFNFAAVEVEWKAAYNNGGHWPTD
jgi:hypothetical protein